MAVNRTKGGDLTVTIDSIDHTEALINAVIVAELADNDVVTYTDVNSGGSYDYFLDITALQDFQATSLWRLIFENPGEEYAFTWKPYATAVGANSPEFSGTLRVLGMPQVGAEANTTWQFEYRFALTGKPVMDVTP